MTTKKERIYWCDDNSNKDENVYLGQGGIYFRSDFGRFIDQVENQYKKKVIAIKLAPDTENKEEYSWNIEIITEKRDE